MDKERFIMEEMKGMNNLQKFLDNTLELNSFINILNKDKIQKSFDLGYEKRMICNALKIPIALLLEKNLIILIEKELFEKTYNLNAKYKYIDFKKLSTDYLQIIIDNIKKYESYDDYRKLAFCCRFFPKEIIKNVFKKNNIKMDYCDAMAEYN